MAALKQFQRPTLALLRTIGRAAVGGTVALSGRAQSARPTRSTYNPGHRLLTRENGITSEARRPVGDSKIASRLLNATVPRQSPRNAACPSGSGRRSRHGQQA
jgi:hypothetical protein